MRGSGRACRYCAREWRTSVSSPNVVCRPVGMSVGQPSGPINKMVIPHDYTIFVCTCTYYLWIKVHISIMHSTHTYGDLKNVKTHWQSLHFDRQLIMVVTQPGKSSTASVRGQSKYNVHVYVVQPLKLGWYIHTRASDVWRHKKCITETHTYPLYGLAEHVHVCIIICGTYRYDAYNSKYI